MLRTQSGVEEGISAVGIEGPEEALSRKLVLARIERWWDKCLVQLLGSASLRHALGSKLSESEDAVPAAR